MLSMRDEGIINEIGYGRNRLAVAGRWWWDETGLMGLEGMCIIGEMSSVRNGLMGVGRWTSRLSISHE